MKQMVWKLFNAVPEVLAIAKINTLSNGNAAWALFPLERISFVCRLTASRTAPPAQVQHHCRNKRGKLALEEGAQTWPVCLPDSSLIQMVSPMLRDRQAAEPQLDTQQVHCVIFISLLAATASTPGVTAWFMRRNSRNSFHANATNAERELRELISLTHGSRWRHRNYPEFIQVTNKDAAESWGTGGISRHHVGSLCRSTKESSHIIKPI